MIGVGCSADSRVLDCGDLSNRGVSDDELDSDGVLGSEDDDVDHIPELFPFFIFNRRGGTVRMV